MSTLLLEIGLEEVPAAFMPGALKDLKTAMGALLEEARLDHAGIESYGTPRRLVVGVEGLAEAQADLIEIVRGPAVKIAYDDEGQPSKALQGFCRSQGIDPADVYTDRVKGQDYVFAETKTIGQSADTLLQELLPELIQGLQFPKMMRWGDYNMRFVRPIHWLLALLDDQVIPFDLEMLSSGRQSRGHRFLAPDVFDISEAEAYPEAMEAAWVLVDPEERKRTIIAQMEKLEKEEGFSIERDEKLLEEVVHLVEYPRVFMGAFKDSYLDLPEGLVITPMKDHQRYFPVFDPSGRLVPYFIGVRNGGEEFLQEVQKGNEQVLEARLQDALFFFEEDLKADLDLWVKALRDVVYQEKLGTLYDKSERSQRLAADYSELFGFSQQVSKEAQQAATYAKVDLVSLVVGEFPELQGQMGEIYLKASHKSSDAVAQAVREHYLPRFRGDDLPKSPAGLVLSIADKMDTIVGCFAAGIEPTGSQDPYALRRQAAGVVAMMVDSELDVSLNEMIEAAIKQLPDERVEDPKALQRKVLQFFGQRLRTFLEDKGYHSTFVRAILKADYDHIQRRVNLTAEAYQWIKSSPEAFEEMKAMYKRVYNILESEQAQGLEKSKVDPDLLQDNAEKDLFAAVEKVYANISALNHRARLDAFLALTPLIVCFFDDVMVMVDDAQLRQNRLSLLGRYMKLVSDLIRIEAL